MIESAAKGHPACMGYYGGALLLGNIPGIPQDRKAAMPLLLRSASAGYYVAASRLFRDRQRRVSKRQFDFSDRLELERALCWGRLAQQHTSAAGFDYFLEQLRQHAREKNQPELIELLHRYDPRRVPSTRAAVDPEDCTTLEGGLD